MSDQRDKKESRVSLLQVAKSVAAAFFGVQSEENRSRDFQHGKASHFIVIGLLATIVFILILWFIVKLVLHLAGI